MATKGRLVRIARWVLGFGVLAYLGLALLLYALQNLILFPPTGAITLEPSSRGWDFEDVFLDAGGGETTHAWWMPVANARGVCIHSHGNGANLSGWLDTFETLRKLGLSVLAYDYGGYGKSTGSASEERLYADIRAAWRHVTEARGVAPERVILFGRSLGGAPTAQLAAEVQPGGVVLESTFASLPEMAQEAFPWLPARWLVRYRFDTRSKMKDVHAPVLVVHSPEDSLVPYRHGRAIFDAANEPKSFQEIHGDHNEGYVLSEAAYLAGWRAFLERALAK